CEPGGTGGHSGSDRAGALVVRNTQSRTLPPAEAARRVRTVLAPLGAGFRGIVLKKIDTGLRGPLGAELDAAMDALGAQEAFVVPAIPEVGRTTVGGEQLIGGVPVHRTAFATDPENPVRDARVAHVIASTARRQTACVTLEAVRYPGALDEAIGAVRTRGAAIVVLDAETDGDLERGVEALLGRARPLLLVGSTGLARALRGSLAAEAPGAPAATPPDAGGTGVLVVSGSAHPLARVQRVHAVADGALLEVEVGALADAERAGRRAAGLLAGG